MKILLLITFAYVCNAYNIFSKTPEIKNKAQKTIENESVNFQLSNTDSTLDLNTFIINSYSTICSNRIATITNCNNIGQIYKPVLFIYDNENNNKTMFNKLYIQDTANTRDATFNYLFMLLDLTNFVNNLTPNKVYKQITVISVADVNNIVFYLKIVYKLY